MLAQLRFAKASSCRAAVRTAQGVVADLGTDLAKRSPGLNELANINQKNSERDYHKVVADKYKLSLPIELGVLPKSHGVSYTGDMSVIPLFHWLRFLVTFNTWHTVVGLMKPDPAREVAILTEWWKRFKQLKPHHQIWNEFSKHGVDVGRCCPLLLHGDEGRGRKKGPFLVVQYHSMMGRGTVSANAQRTKRPYVSMKLNYCGNAFTHRMMTACLPKMLKDEVALKDLFDFLTKDSLQCLRSGFSSEDGKRFHFAIIHIVGDWQFLAKAGNLERSYSTVEKRPRAAMSCPKGICHLCLAGQSSVPFEDLRQNPGWRATMLQPGDCPWSVRPVFLELPHEEGRPATLFAYDLWHGLHLGFGKTFLGAVLALMSQRMPGTSIDQRFAKLTELYLEWTAFSKTPAYITTITKETLQWPDQGTYPNGVWSKGHVTTTLLRFVVWWFGFNDVSDCQLLTLSKEGAMKINECMTLMYANDLWLPQATARQIGDLGLGFCEVYMQCATLAYRERRALFIWMPKAHLCHHVFMEIFETGEGCKYTLNPLSTCVQIDEDMVGKASRLARRVSPLQCIRRVLERFLEASHRHWSEAGFLKTL